MTYNEITQILKSMVIIVDDREKDTPLLHQRLNSFPCAYMRKRLNFGDYSAEVILPNGEKFSLADKVTIDTLSYKEGSKPVHWESEGGTEFAMDKGDKEGNGTKIVLYLNEDSVEFCNLYRAEEVLNKYAKIEKVQVNCSL